MSTQIINALSSAALLVKPKVAGSRRGQQLVASLVEQGAYVVQSSTASTIRSELTNLIANNHAIQTLVAVGGDGTVHLALNAISETDISLAVIPMGTGNDLARAIGINTVNDALRVLTVGSATQSDVGLITLDSGEHRYYIGIASCGFDAQVNERANKYRGPSGTIKYLAAVLREIAGLQAKDLVITSTLDSQTKSISEKCTLVAIGNTNSYGGGMKMCPQASIHDGYFDVTKVAQARRRTLLRVLPQVFSGGHVRHPLVTTSRAQVISVSQADPETAPLLIYADGEFVGAGDATFTLMPDHTALWQAT